MASENSGLVRGMRRWDLVALVLNAIIGAGIFGLPANAFKAAGSYSLFAYAMCAFLIVLIILCFAEVASRFKETGGPYLYVREAFGSFAGFQTGWLLWLARLTAFASLCNLLVGYFSFFVPSVASGIGRTIFITIVTIGLTWVNVVGIKQAALVTDVFTVGKLVPLLLFVIAGAFFIDPGNFSFATAPSYSDFSRTVLLLVFAFSGFEMATIPAGESRDPQKHIPFALLTGIVIVVLLYISIQVVSIGTLPTLADSTRPLADAAGNFFGTAGGVIISAGALISIFGTLNVIVLSGPRLLFAMGQHGQLPLVFGTTHPRYRTPHVAIILSAAIMYVFTIYSSFISALTISTLIRLITYAATCAALPKLRRDPNAVPAGFLAPAGVAVAVAALALCAWLLSRSTLKEAQLVLAAAGLGALLYFLPGLRRREIDRLAARETGT